MVGIETSTDFLQCCRGRRRGRRRSRRASATSLQLAPGERERVLLQDSAHAGHAIRKADLRRGSARVPSVGPGDEPQLVGAGPEHRRRRGRGRDPEPVRAGQQVAQPREHAEEAAVAVVEEDVDAARRARSGGPCRPRRARSGRRARPARSSDGLKAARSSVGLREQRAGRAAKPIAHGMRSGCDPEGRIVTSRCRSPPTTASRGAGDLDPGLPARPEREPSPAGRSPSAARCSPSRSGPASSRRVETLRTVNAPGGPAAAVRERAEGDRRLGGGDLGRPRSSRRRRCRSHPPSAALRPAREEPTSRLRRSAAVSSGRACASSAAAPATAAAATLVPFDGRERGLAVGGRARVGGGDADAGRGELRLEDAAVGEAARRERRHAGRSRRSARSRTVPTRDADVDAAPDPRRAAAREGRRHPDDRHADVAGESRASRPAAPGRRTARPSRRPWPPRPRVELGIGTRRNERRAPGDEAEPRCASKKRGTPAGAASRGADAASVSEPAGATEPSSGACRSTSDVEAAPQDEPDHRRGRARVGRADGERRSGAAGARRSSRTAARPGRRSRPARRRACRGRARRRPPATSGLSANAANGSATPISAIAGRVVRVAVAVRDRPRGRGRRSAGRCARRRRSRPSAVGLPAGDPDRQHGRAGRDAVDAAGAARADEQPGELASRAARRRVGLCGFGWASAVSWPSTMSIPGWTRPPRYGWERSTPVSSSAIETPCPSKPGRRRRRPRTGAPRERRRRERRRERCPHGDRRPRPPGCASRSATPRGSSGAEKPSSTRA